MAISKNSYNLKDKMKNSRLSTIFIILFLIFLPNFLSGQPKSDNKNDDTVNSKVLEERIKQTNNQFEALDKKINDQKNDLKEFTAFRFEEIRDRMNLILWIFGIFVAFITFLGFKTIVHWIKQTIENKTDDYLKKEKIQEIIKKKGEDAVNELISELEKKGKEKIDEIEKLRNDYENALNKIKDIRDISIDKPLPEESKKDLAEFEDKLIKLKKEDKYSFLDLFYKGVTEYKKNNYEEAMNNFTKAIEINPKDAVIYNNRGATYEKLKKYEEAINDFNKAIELDPKYDLTYYNRGTIYAKLNYYEKALNDFNKAIELDPKYASAYYNRGLTYVKLKKYEKALNDFNKAIELDPKYASAYNNRGVTYGKLNKYKEALNDHNKAIELDPKNASGYINRGFTYEKFKKYEEALNDFNKAIEFDPTDSVVYENISELNIIIGNYKSALEYVNKAINLAVENKDKSICLYLKCIIEKLLNMNTTETEKEFNEILKNEFILTWTFEEIENWLKKVNIPEDKKRFIIEKTELLKKKT